jgi:hypothetical protein
MLEAGWNLRPARLAFPNARKVGSPCAANQWPDFVFLIEGELFAPEKVLGHERET